MEDAPTKVDILIKDKTGKTLYTNKGELYSDGDLIWLKDLDNGGISQW